MIGYPTLNSMAGSLLHYTSYTSCILKEMLSKLMGCLEAQLSAKQGSDPKHSNGTAGSNHLLSRPKLGAGAPKK
jgi:hypothetical protein